MTAPEFSKPAALRAEPASAHGAVAESSPATPTGLEQIKQRLLRTAVGLLLEAAVIRIRYWRAFVCWRFGAPFFVRLYRSATRRCGGWPLHRQSRARPRRAAAGTRVVYYVWFFPLPSETFIQREILALRDAGIDVDVVAHQLDDPQHLSADGRDLAAQTYYLPQLSPGRLYACAWPLVLRRPFIIANLFLYTLFRTYDWRKSFARDLQTFARALQLASVLRRKRATRVHTPWASIDAFVALLAARMLDIPNTVHARAYDLHRHSSAAGLELKLRHAAAIITNSHYNHEKIRGLMPGIDSPKIQIIYNGIDLKRFCPPDPRPAFSNVIRILAVGNLVEPKGFEYLLEACSILENGGHELRCEIIGGRVKTETNYYLKLRKLHHALGLENSVEMIGRCSFEDVLERYRNAEIFVLPAVTATHGGRDITPNVLIEAMAMTLPVVSTRSGAIPEIVDDGLNGILVAPRDAAALASAILHLHQNPHRARTLGQNARLKIAERFDIAKNITRFVEIFNRVA